MHMYTVADPGGPGGPGPLAPKVFFKIMQFSGNFKGKKPYFEQILGSGPPPGVKTLLPPHQNPGSAPGTSTLIFFTMETVIFFLAERKISTNSQEKRQSFCVLCHFGPRG